MTREKYALRLEPSNELLRYLFWRVSELIANAMIAVRWAALMDVKDLLYFVTAYEARSFSRAAARLDTVQSNVSARISALEKHLRVRLFERLPQAVQPTAKARELYRSARRIIAAIAKLERQARRGGRKAKTPLRKPRQ
jgi:hypothetical protein